MINDMNQNMQNLQQQGMVSPQMAQQVIQQQQNAAPMPPQPQRAPLQQGEGQVISVESRSSGANGKGEPWQKYALKIADAMQQGRTLTYSKFAKLINGVWEVMPTMGQYIEFAYSVKPNPKNDQFPYKTIMRWSTKQQTPALQEQQFADVQPGVVQLPMQAQPVQPQGQSVPIPQGNYQNQGPKIMQIPDDDVATFKTQYLGVAQQKGITPEENHFLGTYIKNKFGNDPMVQKILAVFKTP